MSLAKAKILASEGKIEDAQKIITTLLDTAQKMQTNQQTTIGYLVSISIKDLTLNTLLVLKNKNLINAQTYKTSINKYYINNKVALKNVFKNGYSLSAQVIDDLANKNYDQFLRYNVSGQVGDTQTAQDQKNADDFISKFEKSRNSISFQPNNTKKLFYNLYKSEFDNVDLPCGSVYVSPIPTFDLKDSKSENFLGKVMFSTSAASFNSLIDKSCLLEVKFNQF